MKKIATTYRERQEQVNGYFQAQSSFWKDIYADNNLDAHIYRNRQAAALAWVDGLALAPGTSVLEIGCGAGFTAAALAQRGFRVHAIDSVEAMIQQARRYALESGVSELLSVDVGDVYALAFENCSFDLVLALGVIPWLSQPELAMQEMARVIKPGGHVILTADNRARLNSVLDPWSNPLLVPLRKRLRSLLEQIGLRRHPSPGEALTAFADYHSCRIIDQALTKVGLMKSKGMTLGFGPFTLRGHKLFPERSGIAVHHRLQRLAELNVPIFRSTGAHYLVLARKPVFQASYAIHERPQTDL